MERRTSDAPLRTGEKDDVAPDRKRPWTKPRIRTMRIVGIDTHTGVQAGKDEDTLSISTHVANYASIS